MIRHTDNTSAKTIERHLHKTSQIQNTVDTGEIDHHISSGSHIPEDPVLPVNTEQIYTFTSTIPVHYEASVVLAVNPDALTLSTANNQGLQAKYSLYLPSLDMTVTAFEIPAGEDVVKAIEGLQDKGASRLILNQYYHLDAAPEQEADSFDHPVALGSWPVTCLSSTHDIKIGMVDSYVDVSQSLLVGQHIIRNSFTRGAKKVASDHGTAIAELLVGNRTESFSGLLPAARIYAAAAFTDEDSTTPRATVLAIVKSLDWLVSQKVQVVNLSFSGPDNHILDLAIRKVLEKGIPVVAAAGNHGRNGPPAYPGAYAGVIAVTAIDRFFHPYRDANQGEYISFAAPGVRVPIPCQNGGICYKTGTSFAVPYCTANVAMFLPEGKQVKLIKPIISSLRKNVIDLGTPGRDPVFGWGVVQCDTACQHGGQ